MADLDALMYELSATSFYNEELLNNALNDANVHVYVIRNEGHIVATGTLCIKHTLEFAIADVESVVVSSKCRGRGYGNGADDGYQQTVQAIKNEAHEIHDELTKENILEKFQDAFHEHAFEKIIELGGKVTKNAVLHKLGLA